MTFASREDAGRRLGVHLRERGLETGVVLGLPRGGVVVAAEVARILHRPLDVLIVRKIGHPFHREFAVGAMAEHGVILLDETVIGSDEVVRAKLNQVIHDEEARLREYELKFHSESRCDLKARSVLLVDDGLATGATLEAAALSVGIQRAREIIVAAPVASISAVERLRRVVDDVLVLFIDPDFQAVGNYYESFPQTSDEEVVELLKAGRGVG
jgi:predicted phosphoribosyltransferase